MLAFKVEIRKNEMKVGGTLNMKIEVTYNRGARGLATRIFIRTEDLTKNFKLRSPKYIKEVNKLVRYYEELYTGLPLKASNLTLSDVLDCIQKEKGKNISIDFIQFCKDLLTTIEVKGRRNYQTTPNTFIAFLGKDKLNTNRITRLLTMEFMEYPHKKRTKQVVEPQRKGKRMPSNRMVFLYMGNIKHLFNKAKKKYNDYDRNAIRTSNPPFKNLDVSKQEATRKKALSIELIKEVWELSYTINTSGKEGLCPFNLAKDCFILSLCLIGINSADLCSCTEMGGGSITYYRTKTTDRRLDKTKIKVNIFPILLLLMKGYEDHTQKKAFCFYHLYSTLKSFDRAINLGLKQTGKTLKIDDLEYYTTGYSWVILAVNEVGIDKYAIYATSNRIDEAMKVTDIYIERDFEVEDEVNRKVVEYIFSNRNELFCPEVK